ncbi:MAG: hypothetical protein LUD19_00635 [Clostridia bacterium]|nr:hypothetical protein [Clostridia bacterium]MCD8308329.1 hypothetical protein [Clostridia bacterium]
MTFVTYAQRQKNIIRERHFGEERFVIGGQEVPVKSREQILRELSEMKGLNKKERTACPKRCSEIKR